MPSAKCLVKGLKTGEMAATGKLVSTSSRNLVHGETLDDSPPQVRSPGMKKNLAVASSGTERLFIIIIRYNYYIITFSYLVCNLLAQTNEHCVNIRKIHWQKKITQYTLQEKKINVGKKYQHEK